MKECNLCNSLGDVHYRVKSINYKNWIFCCKNCLIMISRKINILMEEQESKRIFKMLSKQYKTYIFAY